MAVAVESFSIREYAARMRAADLSKCWPFDTTAAAGDKEPSLPPMQPRRFRWWAHELAVAAAAAAAEEKEERRPPAGRRRKRSIVELFAAVPQIEKDAKGVGRKEKGRKNAKKKLGLEIKGKKVKKKKKKRKKKKTERVQIDEISVHKKEKSNKPKMISLSIAELLQGAVQKRKFKKFLNRKKKHPEVEVLLEKQNLKTSPEPVPDNQKAIAISYPIQSILKKQFTTSSMLKGRLLSNTCVGHQPKPSSEAKKHVTFSGKDDILGKNASLAEDSTEESQLIQMSQLLCQRNKPHDGDKPHDTESKLVYEKEIDVDSGPVEDNISSLSEKVNLIDDVHSATPSTEPRDLSNENHLEKERTILGDSLDLNHCIDMSNNYNCLNSSSSAAMSSQVHLQDVSSASPHQTEGSEPVVSCQAESSHLTPHELSLPNCLASEKSAGDLVRNLVSQPSDSCLVTNLEVNDKNKSAFFGGKQNANCHLPEVQPRFHHSGKDVMSSICSSTGSNKSTDTRLTADCMSACRNCMSACRNVCFNEDYVGLPLNSQGEFVKVHPGATINPNEMFKRQYMGEGASGSSSVQDVVRPKIRMDYANTRIGHHPAPVYMKDNFGFHPEPCYTPMMPVMYGIGFRQLPGFESMEIRNYGTHRDKHLSAYHNEYSMNSFCSGCMEPNHRSQNLFQVEGFLPNHNFNQTIQPAAKTTMRLMGTTVMLGKNTKQCSGLNMEKILADKIITAEDSSSGRICNKSFPQLPQGELVACRISGAPNEGRIRSVEIPSRVSSIPAVELRFSLGNDSPGMNGPSQQPQAMPTKQSMHSLHRYNEFEFAHQMAAHSQNIGQHVLLNSTHFRHSQSVSASSISNPQNSYRNFVERRPVQSSQLPQWPGSATRKIPISSFPSNHGSAVHHHCIMPASATKFTSFPSAFSSSMISYPAYTSTNVHPRASTPIIYPSFPSVYPSSKSGAGANITCKNRGRKWNGKISNLEGVDCRKTSNKRAAERDDGFLNPSKKPHLERGLNLLTVLEKKQQRHGLRPDTGSPEMPVCHNKVHDMNLHSTNCDMNAKGRSSTGRTKSGPVKLQPGAKHILKPSPSTDQENSRPVHSTISFVVGTNFCTGTTSEKGTAEIYRF